MSSMEMLLRQPLIQALGWALVHFLWQGALVAMLLGGVDQLLRRAGGGGGWRDGCTSDLQSVRFPHGAMARQPPGMAGLRVGRGRYDALAANRGRLDFGADSQTPWHATG